MRTKEIFSFDTETRNGGAFICSTYGKGKAKTFKIKSEADVTDFMYRLIDKEFGNVGFAYNLDYDVIALLKYYGDLQILRLYLEKEITIKDMKIGYIPKKFLYIQRNKKIVYVFELMQYFNMSLDKAGEIYLGERKDDFTKAEKKRIYSIYKKNPKRVIKYCEQDARLTTRLAEKLDTMVSDFGLSIQKYYSCGYIAKQYLKSKDIKYPPLRDEKIIEMVKPAYFGGRIEFTQRGYFKSLYQYDINSAYPFACAKLENIINCRRLNFIDKTAKYFFADCEIEIKRRDISPLAYRDKNLIVYPSGKIRQRIDNFTYDTLKKEGSIIKVYDVLNVYTDGTKPFERMINTLYKRRMVCKEDEKYIIKIILNSLYGKFAEKRKDYIKIEEEEALILMDKALTKNLGSRVLDTEIGYYVRQIEYSKHSNLMYASLITSYIRNYLYDVIKEMGTDNVIGTMTDCIFSKTKLPIQYISEKKEIGKFSLKEKSECYIVGSGVYCSDSGSKLRGYNLKANLITMAKENRYADVLRIKSTERKGMGKLVVQGIDIMQLNEISDAEKVLNLNFDVKREWYGGFKNFGESLTTSIQSNTILR